MRQIGAKGWSPGSVLLTGNTGYIGTVMTAYLKQMSYTVVGLDSNWFEDNILFPAGEDFMPDKQIVKDIRSVSTEDLDGIDAVIHLAGLSNDPLGELNPALTEEINSASTITLARLAKARGIKRFIFSSSCSIYGISRTKDVVNESSQLNPLTEYAKAKVRAEAGLSRMADKKFSPVFMRNATVYGLSPRLRLDLVVNNLLAWAYLTGEVNIMSDGTPWRPILHVLDLCNAFAAVLEAPIDIIHCQAFNVGREADVYQVKDIAYEVQKHVPESKVKILNQTGPDERSYRVDFSKIRKTLPQFNPEWNLTKGIAELLDGYRRYNLSLEDFESGKYFRVKAIKSLIESGKIDNDLLLMEAKDDRRR